MKRIITYITLIIIFTTLGFLGLFNQPKEVPSKDILNNTYYLFNTNTGEYESMMITKDVIVSNVFNLELNNCSNYTYNDKTRIVKLNCGRAFTILSGTTDTLALNMSDKTYYFYKDKENTFIKEFNSYFKESKHIFETNTNELLKTKKITFQKLTELFNTQETNYIYVKPNTCDYKCMIIESKLNTLENSYYIDNKDITDFAYINEEKLKKDLPFFIIITNTGSYYGQENTISTSKYIEFKGFQMEDLKSYLGGTNEEENN